VTKEELRALLAQQAEQYIQQTDKEVITYAAQGKPSRQPWRRRSTIRDEAFQTELERMERDLQRAKAESA
jgi:hypothetical protein